MEKDWLVKVGSPRQVAGTRHCLLSDGASNGMRTIDVHTGAGLQFTILPDRGMDIGMAFYKGVNFTYLSLQEEMHPAFCRTQGDEWLRTFFGGLLTTCGPQNFGPACEDGGEALGLHGTFNCTPARNVRDLSEAGQGKIEISGTIGDFVLFGPKIEIRRTIRCEAGKNVIRLTDVIANRGDEPAPLMMLYHINFGYPFLDSETVTEVNGSGAEAYDEYSTRFMDGIHAFGEPARENREKNYLHRFVDREGKARVINGELGFTVSVRFDTGTLPYLSHWKCERVRDYVLALEPCNAPCIGRREAREKGLLKFIGPGETVTHRVEIAIEENI